jgi:low temperature requirement protein LtrA
VVGALFHGDARLAVWATALVLDMAGPLFIDTTGWRLVAPHFAERHGLIVIVALGESIVAIGVGADSAGVDGGVIAAAILGMAVAAAFWWLYFDVSALAAARRLEEEHDVKTRNELARDAFSYLHLLLVAAIVLVALGMKTTLGHVGNPLRWEIATAFVGGTALYLLAHVMFKLRALRTFSAQRLVAALALLALVPLAHEFDALVTVALVGAVLWLLIVYESVRFAEARDRVRHGEHPVAAATDAEVV